MDIITLYNRLGALMEAGVPETAPVNVHIEWESASLDDFVATGECQYCDSLHVVLNVDEFSSTKCS
jgi:hypothetical protein